MDKIVIIGSPGSGKSTLARDLGSILHINVVHLDRIFWQPGWKEKPRDTRIEILQELVREKNWIIEGTYLGSSEPRLNAADTIIFLDIDPAMCLQRIIKRHREYRGCSRRDIPEGCKDKPNLIRILKVLVFPFRGKRTLKQKLPYYESMSKEIIWLHSSKQVEDFLAQFEPQTNKKKQFSKAFAVAGKKQLATARR
ncbi:MAG TPA: AAA family ATPase [Methylomirabilota bacterium]|nr:AAA family ATPase [Methylomirabilota bacterium]